jgi:hypothetical protein
VELESSLHIQQEDGHTLEVLEGELLLYDHILRMLEDIGTLQKDRKDI